MIQRSRSHSPSPSPTPNRNVPAAGQPSATLAHPDEAPEGLEEGFDDMSLDELIDQIAQERLRLSNQLGGLPPEQALVIEQELMHLADMHEDSLQTQTATQYHLNEIERLQAENQDLESQLRLLQQQNLQQRLLALAQPAQPRPQPEPPRTPPDTPTPRED